LGAEDFESWLVSRIVISERLRNKYAENEGEILKLQKDIEALGRAAIWRRNYQTY